MHISDLLGIAKPEDAALKLQPGQSCSSLHNAETQTIHLWGIWGIFLEFDQFRSN